MKFRRALVVGAVLFLLVGVSPAFASSAHSNPHSGNNPHDSNNPNSGNSAQNSNSPRSALSLTMTGAILDSGSQSYYHTGGHLVEAVILGTPVTTNQTVLHYSLQATVSELTVSGSANFSLVALYPGGEQLIVNGSAVIGDMIPAESFPLGCTYGTDCASAIPGVFLALGSVTVQECHGNGNAGKCVALYQKTVSMDFESAFLNPFGGPIFMSTSDGAVYMVADYSQSRVTWTGIQLGGTMKGSLAGSPVTGDFLMNVNATEDLRAGYELEHGTIAFSSGNTAVEAAGTFVGRSTIPAGTPCPPSYGLPRGTCQITGFESAGTFRQTNSLGESIVGSYSTQWYAPAVIFTSEVNATVK